MNKLINFLINLCSSLIMYLQDRQEKIFYKKVIKICNKLSKLTQENIEVYLEVTYYTGREATIYFSVLNEEDSKFLFKYLKKNYSNLFASYNFDFIVSNCYIPSYCSKLIWSNNE